MSTISKSKIELFLVRAEDDIRVMQLTANLTHQEIMDIFKQETFQSYHTTYFYDKHGYKTTITRPNDNRTTQSRV